MKKSTPKFPEGFPKEMPSKGKERSRGKSSDILSKPELAPLSKETEEKILAMLKGKFDPVQFQKTFKKILKGEGESIDHKFLK